MPTTIHHIPIAAIAEDALVRDRTHMDPEALEELTGSIRADGLRLPIEVFVLDAPKDGRTHGLISGFRRLTAVRALAEEGVAGVETAAAFVRTPADMAAAMLAMVEENEVREEITPWDRGRLLVTVAEMELFEDVDAAIVGLHPRASRMQRTRLRAFARAVEEFDYVFATPGLFSQLDLMRLAAAARAGFGEVITAAVAEVGRKERERQREAALAVVAEFEAERAADDAAGQPMQRMVDLRPTLRVRQVRVKGGWSFRFTGPDADMMLMDSIFSDIETRFGIQ